MVGELALKTFVQERQALKSKQPATTAAAASFSSKGQLEKAMSPIVQAIEGRLATAFDKLLSSAFTGGKYDAGGKKLIVKCVI